MVLQYSAFDTILSTNLVCEAMFAKWQEDTQPLVKLPYLCLADCCRYTNFVISRLSISCLVQSSCLWCERGRQTVLCEVLWAYLLFLWHIFIIYLRWIYQCSDPMFIFYLVCPYSLHTQTPKSYLMLFFLFHDVLIFSLSLSLSNDKFPMKTWTEK